MFEWAHILHRQLYDVLADERLDRAAKDREVARLVAYYKSRRDLAFSSRPKSMKLMQEQPYSLAFRQKYPKFNGLIWAYHWMQIGLYEPLVAHATAETRQAGVRATVGRFWQMLGDPPRTFPHQMPMTPAVAPTFAARYPEAAIIFDNLHSMHDVVSDVLANPSVPRGRKRAEILLAARRFRDDTSYVMPTEAWLTMARHMGVENMGGPAVGFLAPPPTPTVSYGAVMTHDDRTGEMTGFAYGQATGDAHAGHPSLRSGQAPTPAAPRDTAHAHRDTTARDTTAHATAHADARADAHARQMMALHERMMADPAIRRRVLADTAMRRMMREMLDGVPAEHREHMRALLDAEPAADSGRVRKDAVSRARVPVKPLARPPAKPPARDTSARHVHRP
jgi:hypothetical protein